MGRETSVVRVGQKVIEVEVARTQQEHERGLSKRMKLPPENGMFFVFTDRGQYSFWMKDMMFPLDFIWIDGDKVVEITQDVPFPETGKNITTVTPAMPIDKVIEVNGGFINSANIHIGDKFEVLN
ncbi:MAG: hypothetical protein UW69_C0045G0012 [Microgenomates group bacterium GW2011_GWA2_44_7]|uniref:DUF192 domain-containing protein n=1 Tax=Candidatus Woesebacteria bacterium GW2011_GWA1_41_13b TaxID=1618555 RepID=A0A0G0UVY6_9BACT|nr:MAG: hypothetical protein UU42_C0008G0012 [Candidatus Woesebacteria bacterium GW2011_GWA1_41_13b]KKT74185.1 MAG: hypothetical protein UW69_C0045G0012 [Microgenomates group bacterium GW2011_GWA2_44_7]